MTWFKKYCIYILSQYEITVNDLELTPSREILDCYLYEKIIYTLVVRKYPLIAICGIYSIEGADS